MSNAKRISVSKTAITLDSIKKGEFQKEDTLSAQLSQTITTDSFYPSKKVDSNMQDNLFDLEAFGFAEQKFTSTETRKAWIPVPTSVTEEQVSKMLAKVSAEGACIYKVLSNAPIIDDNQQYAIDASLKTKDDFANTQVVRHPEGAKGPGGDDISDTLLLDKAGNVQYRRTFYSKLPKADVDLRNGENVYMSPEIAAEIKGAAVFEHQTV
jgi:hypothetical protein